MYDILLVYPLEPRTAYVTDATFRRTMGAHLFTPVAQALAELEGLIGRPLSFWHEAHALSLGGDPVRFSKYRSLATVALATHLERAGLRWKALDPGPQELGYWRRRLRSERSDPPRAVAVSTTFSLNSSWLDALCRVVREELPGSKLVIGGYYYATNTRRFLSFDADVFSVGEGELRLPRIVAALRDGSSLEDIPGLYIRDPSGELRHTGHPEPLELETLSPPDWRLAERIEPRLNLDEDAIELGVETQRGCVFRCEFCTYRTLASPRATSPEHAVEAILRTGVARRGFINILDATATFPHKRWRAVLDELVRRGGAPHPVWAYARVSDITGEVARKMALAGVRHVFVGQESGDQRILDAMKKGTAIRQVKPAVAALGAHGITATFSFIHGFPGETNESLEATRRLVTSLNEGFEDSPVVTGYTPFPFLYSDFASVSRDPVLKNADHYLDYGSAPMAPERAAREVIATILATSRVPHAPAALLLFEGAPPTTGISLFAGGNRGELFRWMKAVERGVAIFLERDLEGRRPNERELENLRCSILSGYRVPQPWRRLIPHKMFAAARARLLRRLGMEWRREAQSGPGLVTRSLLFALALRDRGVLRSWKAWREARPVDGRAAGPGEGALASALIDEALSAPVKLRVSPGRL